MASLSVIIPVLNGATLIGDCLRSLEAQCSPGDEIIVVDNDSTDGTPDVVTNRFPQARLFRERHNLGFAGGINRGLGEAAGQVLVLVNHDITLSEGCLNALRRRLEQSEPAIVGCKLLYPDGRTIQHAGGVVEYPRADTSHRGHHELDQGQWDIVADVDYVTGALIAFNRMVMDRIGLFDEGFFPIYYEEVDFCYRARSKGCRVLYDPAAVAIHHESQWQSPRSEAYHLAAQSGRLRFVLKNHTPDQILIDFVPAERRYLLALPEEALMTRRVLAQAYFKALLTLFDLGHGHGRTAFQHPLMAESARAIESALIDLQATAMRLTEHVVTVNDLPWQVEERPFTSRWPIIARVREAWNNISAKWFVRAILQQQNRYNRILAEQVAETSQRVRLHNGEFVAVVRALNALSERVVHLEAERTLYKQPPGSGSTEERV